MSVLTTGNRSAGLEKSPLNLISATAKMATATLREWRRNYRSRRELALYSHDERSDLSFSAEVDAEIGKPFWKR